MSKQPRMFRRGGKWTFRARVPDELRPIIGKKEIWKSLGDVNHAEAVRLARVESVRLDEFFDQTRRESGLVPQGKISDAQIEQVARAYFYRLEVKAPPMAFSAADRAERRDTAEEEAALVAQTVEDAGLQRVAMSVAREAKVAPKLEGEALVRLTEAVQRALLEHYGREADRAELLPEKVRDPLFVDVAKSGPPPASPLTLGRAVDIFMSEPDRSGIAPKTRVAYEFRLALLKDLLGADTPISNISRAEVRDARDILLVLPANSTKRWPGMPARKVAELAKREGLAPMSPQSVTAYVEALSALFKWLTKEELAERNPAVGLKGPPIPEETGRRPFTTAELNALFVAPAFMQGRGGKKGWAYWLPRLALFSGARFAELLGLKAADVIEAEGVPLIRIEPNDVRALKTKTSRRLVPVHAELIKLGFLDYAASVPKGGLLFPDAAGPRNMTTAQNQAMGRALRAVITDKAVVFHSFRHSFKDAGERADIPREALAAIGGWDLPGGKSAMDSYGRAKFATKLAVEMAKIIYPGVEL